MPGTQFSFWVEDAVTKVKRFVNIEVDNHGLSIKISRDIDVVIDFSNDEAKIIPFKEDEETSESIVIKGL